MFQKEINTIIENQKKEISKFLDRYGVNEKTIKDYSIKIKTDIHGRKHFILSKQGQELGKIVFNY